MKSRHRKSTPLLASSLPIHLAVFLLLWAGGAMALGADDVVHVRFGYFRTAEPFIAACGRGWLDLAPNVEEDLPAYEVGCFSQSSGSVAVSRLDNADLDISALGSTPWAEAVARGVDLKEIYIRRYAASLSGIYVREDTCKEECQGIQSPRDLINRTIATPFGSNSHYHLKFLIKEFELIGMVDVIDLSPTDIIEAWNGENPDLPSIDGAACWGTTREYLLENEGRELIPAGVFTNWGAPAYSVTAVRRVFADEHPLFMEHLVGILSRITDSFLDRFGMNDPQNAARWGIRENNTVNYVWSIVDAQMRPKKTPDNPSKRLLIQETKKLDMSIYQTTSEQLTCNHLGNISGSCHHPTGQHLGARNIAQFLLDQKELSTLGIMNPLLPLNIKDDSCTDNSSFCGGSIIDPTYLVRSRTGNVSGTPLGPYEAFVENVDESDHDAVLTQLERLDAAYGRLPYAAYEVGRASGDRISGHSNCTDNIKISDYPNGTFGDGANALPGRSYSNKQHCKWTIFPSADGGLVEVRVQRLKIWSGDFVRIYSGGVPGCPGNKPRTLMAQLSGMYENDKLPDALPPFRSSTCIVVEFDSDGKEEFGYAVNEDFGDGFELFYSRAGVPKNDCNGKHSDPDGLCLCDGTSWGGDCSHNSFCLGSTRVKIEEGKTNVVLSSVHATEKALSFEDDNLFIVGQDKHPYPNDLDCTYELDLGETSFNLAKVELYYDIEETYDLLRLQSGLDENTTYYVVSGRHSRNETFYVPVDESGKASLHFTTDDKGRRLGFYAKISGENSQGSTCEDDHFGPRCESRYCLQWNTIQNFAAGSETFAGRVISQDQSSSVRAMPWAQDGGCTWEIEPMGDSTGVLRLVIKSFELEPYPEKAVGDKVIFASLSGGPVTELFIESCEYDEGTCTFPWQTGECAKGRCVIRSQIDLAGLGANVRKTLIQLVTDRNDGGENYSGIDFDVHHVQSCPATSCAIAGGRCDENHLCTCKNSFACDCPCDDDDNDYSAIIVGSVACAVALVLGVLFLLYRRKKKNIIKMHQSTIERNTDLLQRREEQLKRKEAELEVFQLGTSKFGDAVNFIDSLLKPTSPLADQNEVANLLLVKRCLIMGTEKELHVPDNLTKNPTSRYIMKEFAGVNVSNDQMSASVLASSENLKRISQSKVQHEEAGILNCLPEFARLDLSQQTSLFELLSFSKLREWDFNVFDISAIDEENTLLFVAWAIIGSPYSQFAMAKQLGQSNLQLSHLEGYSFADLDMKIEFGTLFSYLRAIQKDYKPSNPYHNAIHAADVVQTLHSLIHMAGNLFDAEEIFSILVASAVHDVKHPGMNNAFQTNTFSTLALIHNDAAVLESEHSYHAYKLMIQGLSDEGDNLNFLCHVTTPKFAEIRKRIIEAVLHTDMSKHFSTVASIKNQTVGKTLDEMDLKLRWGILMYMLHLADISNPAKGSPMFQLWTDRCLDEFFAQGDNERKLGLPISPNCDRNETKKPESQIGFINFVVKPAYEVLAGIIPMVGENILPIIENNLMYWEDQKGR